jgi:hypothetical protein
VSVPFLLMAMTMLVSAEIADASQTIVAWLGPGILTLTDRVQRSSVVIRGRVIGLKKVDPKHLADRAQPETLAVVDGPAFKFPAHQIDEFTVVADRVLKGCLRPGERIRVWQGGVLVSEIPRIAKGDTAVLMLRSDLDWRSDGREHYSVYYEVPIRSGRPGVETEFRQWPVDLLEARVDSIAAAQEGDTILNDKKVDGQTLRREFGSISGQIVTHVDNRLRALAGVQVSMDGREPRATTNEWGRFHLEAPAGEYVLTFSPVRIKPRKVRIRPGCFDFVQITAPR